MKRNHGRQWMAVALGVFMLNGWISSTACAAIIQVTETNASQTFFVASATDLINAGSPALAGRSDIDYTGWGGATTAALNDGLTGAASDVTQSAFDIDGTWVSTYTLDTSSAPNGYAITNIQTIAAWPPSRQGQSYELLYSTVAAPNTYISLGTFSVSPGGSMQSSRITLTDSAGSIAEGVKSIRFSVADPGNVYREFDVFGYVMVPKKGTVIYVK